MDTERIVKKEVTYMFESVLNFCEVACNNTQTYKVLRSKILRLGNNCIRNLVRKLDEKDEDV